MDDFNESFKLTERVLSWVGLKVVYPVRKPGLISWLKSEAFYLVSFMELLITVIGEFIYIYGALGQSFLEVTALAPCIGFCILGMTKMHAISSRRRVLQQLVDELRELWPREELPSSSQAIMQSHLKGVRKTTTGFFWLYTVLICLFNADPLLIMATDLIQTGTYQKGHPYFVWYPFNEHKPFVYELVFLYQIWSGYIAAIGIVGPDCLFQVSCSHICMLLRLLQEELLVVVPEPPEEGYTFPDEESCAKIKTLIQKHQKLIKLAGDLERIYSFVIMVNIVAGSFIICLVGFQATSADTKELVKFAIFLFSSLVQVLILSWYGNLLIETSVGVADAAYNCRWYNAGPCFKRMLHIVIVRAKKPLTISAMKFSVVSLNSFTSILSTSWSYFTLLKTVYNE